MENVPPPLEEVLVPVLVPVLVLVAAIIALEGEAEEDAAAVDLAAAS